MLMIVMSLAISLVSTSSFFSLTQQGKDSNQKAQSYRAQQEKKESKYPAVLNTPSGIIVQPVALPPGDSAWAVQIVTRGGFSGSGRGDMTLSSDGLLVWNGTDGSCSRRLADEAMQAIAKVVIDADSSAFSNFGSPAGMCADCYVTAMVVQRRSASAVQVSSASWDDASREKVPADVMSIYESLMALRGCKLQ
jgi:hypothetical protein